MSEADACGLVVYAVLVLIALGILWEIARRGEK